MPEYAAELGADALNQRRRCLNWAKIFVLGVTYKRGVGDTRESPALEILARLRAKGAEVAYADPHAPSVVLGDVVLKALEVTDDTLAAADCVLILTDHAEFDYRRVVDRAPLVVDTRNVTWGLPTPMGRVIRL